jgi:exopolysaccharide biosynthesis operon protein EpsL
LAVLVNLHRPPFRLGAIYAASFFAMLAMSSSARAEGLIDIKPYVAVSEVYDDNLFRVSGKDEALAVLGTDKMSDQSRRTEAGVDVDWKISRQHVLLSMNFNQNKFDRFSFLDNNGSTKRLAWNWVIGSHLGGELSISENKSMGGFTEINNPALNMHTDKRKLMSINWDFHPDWRLHLQRDETEYANSQKSFRTSDRTDVAHEAAIQYTTSAGNRISLSAREVDTQYDQRDAFSAFFFGNGNQQRELGLNVTWMPSGKTRLNGRIARVERSYEEFTQRDVNAWAGNVGVDWQPTGKTTLSVAASRGIDAVDDLASTYVQNDTFSISPAQLSGGCRIPAGKGAATRGQDPIIKPVCQLRSARKGADVGILAKRVARIYYQGERV